MLVITLFLVCTVFSVYRALNNSGFCSLNIVLIVSIYHWRGHQTSPTEVSLKRRLPQKLLSKSTLSCEIVQIHSLFRHGFIKKPKSQFKRNIRILFLCDGFRKTDLGVDLMASLFSIFSSFIFFSIIYLFEKRKGAYSCLKDNHSFIFIQRMVSLMVILFSTKCFLFVYMYRDLSKLKAY